jgi:hypothetical protein
VASPLWAMIFVIWSFFSGAKCLCRCWKKKAQDNCAHVSHLRGVGGPRPTPRPLAMIVPRGVPTTQLYIIILSGVTRPEVARKMFGTTFGSARRS